jgi:hypothetical protein
MRASEIERQMRRALRYPRVWFTSGLLAGELLELQFRALRRKVGCRSRPLAASEHWRYGAFAWWLGRIEAPERLLLLLGAAAVDPDEPMGRAVAKEIAAHPLSSEAVRERALTLHSTRTRNRELPLRGSVLRAG